MTKDEFKAILDRTNKMQKQPEGAHATIVCVRTSDNEIMHPDELGADRSLDFTLYCEAMAAAVRDRRKLLEWVCKDFELPADYYQQPAANCEPADATHDLGGEG